MAARIGSAAAKPQHDQCPCGYRPRPRLARQKLQGLSADPMEKVRKMVEGMITRLEVGACRAVTRPAFMIWGPVLWKRRAPADSCGSVQLSAALQNLQEESSEDMEHRDWCDKEMGQNEKARTSHETDVEDTQAKVESAESEVAKLGIRNYRAHQPTGRKQGELGESDEGSRGGASREQEDRQRCQGRQQGGDGGDVGSPGVLREHEEAQGVLGPNWQAWGRARGFRWCVCRPGQRQCYCHAGGRA